MSDVDENNKPPDSELPDEAPQKRLDLTLSDDSSGWLADPAPTSDRPEEEHPPEDEDLPPAQEPDLVGDLPDPNKLRRRELLYYLLAALILLVLTGGGIAGFVYAEMARDLPKLDKLSSYRPDLSVEVEDRNGQVVWEFWKERRKLVPYEEIPRVVVDAFRAAEDSSFFEHGGIDMVAIARAAIKNFMAGEVKQGASTITQQVAKTFLLTSERRYERKIKEAILAYRIEKNFTKEEILYLYLNQIFLGNGSYGVKVAAETYFRKTLPEVTVAEAAMLAGLPKAPSTLNPVINFAGATERQRYVLQQMLVNRMITQDEYQQALDEQVVVYPQPKFHSESPHLSYPMEELRLELIRRMGEEELFQSGIKVRSTIDGQMQKHAWEVLRRGIENADKLSGWRGPLRKAPKEEFMPAVAELARQNRLDAAETRPRIGERYQGLVLKTGDFRRKTGRTSTDAGKGALVALSPHHAGIIALADMEWARQPNPNVSPAKSTIKDPAQAVSAGDVINVKIIDAEAAEFVMPGRPEEMPEPVFPLSLEQEPEIQGALIALDPFNGDILAMVGGYSFEKSPFNRTTQALRQPGSAFKPFIYAQAIESGYTQVTKMFDTAVVLPGARHDELWMPKNHDDAFMGEITLRKALALSVNTIAVKLVLDERVSVARSAEFVKRAGMQSEMPADYTLALGSAPVTLLEMVRGLAIFPNGGQRIGSRLLTGANGPDGLPLFRVEVEKAVNEKAGETAPNRIISPTTAYIMTSMLSAVITEGTGGRAARIGRPAGGKTGTSSDNRDAWFVGFDSKLVAGVWMGYDDNRSLGRYASGGLLSAPTWLEFMLPLAPEDPADEQFPIPSDIVLVRIDPSTGDRIADPYLDEYYTSGGTGLPPPVPKPPRGAPPLPVLPGVVMPFVRGTEPSPPAESGDRFQGGVGPSLYGDLEPEDDGQSPHMPEAPPTHVTGDPDLPRD
ncbi:MAG: PBP1A family penicillin-binding protein [Deltaproteobacteria bacterium]|nr:PBP1A family penicillin-binding protein [Deltaproteobacteria bacterium]